jgi:predicted Zn-dependent protease
MVHGFLLLEDRVSRRFIAPLSTNQANSVQQLFHHLSVQLHELGHNLGLSHSGEDDGGYGDSSCYMGKSLILLIFVNISR